MTTSLGMTWFLFGLAVLFIGLSGYFLSLFGDRLGDVTGLEKSWIGMVGLAVVTSLPELVTSISSVRAVDAPDLAAGNVFGSCVFNLMILVLLDFVTGKKKTLYFLSRGRSGHVQAGGFSLLLLFVALLGLFYGRGGQTPSPFGGIGVFTALLLPLYFFSMWYLFRIGETSEHDLSSAMKSEKKRRAHLKKTKAWRPLLAPALGFLLSALGVFAAGVSLPIVAERIVQLMEWEQAFFGSVFVAVATSLPEMVVTLSAFQMGQVDLAVANLFGSNMFNMVALPVADFFYLKGVLLENVSSVHVFTTTVAIAMTGISMMAFALPPKQKGLTPLSWPSWALLVLFVLINGFFALS